MRYTVEVAEVHKRILTFDAPDGSSAGELRKMANDVIARGECEDYEESFEYSHMLPQEHWDVWDKEGNLVRTCGERKHT